MEKFYNSPAWRRIRGLRGFGILALSVAFCLTGLLALSSCDLEFWEDDDDDEVESVHLVGFYTSINTNNESVCTSENVTLDLEGDVADGIPNVRLAASSADFPTADEFSQIGIKVSMSDNNPETIISAYVSANTDGTFDRPGAYFLAAKTDDDIPVAEGETIYTGYWTGYAYRPGGPDTLKPVVVCPYVLIPMAAAVDGNDMPLTCGEDPTNSGVEMSEELAPYLKNDDGSDLRHCQILFDDQDKLNPMPNE